MGVTALETGLARAELCLRALAWRVVELNRYPKRVILATNDFILFNLALWLALSLRLGEPFIPRSVAMFLVLAAAPFIGVATFFQLQVYRMVTRFIGMRGFALTAVAVGLSSLYWGILVYFSGVYSIPRSSIVLYALLSTVLVWMSRQVAAALLRRAGVALSEQNPGKDRNVLIYGADLPGVQLAEALEETPGYRPVAFVDPSQNLARQYVAGLRVFPPEQLPQVVRHYQVEEVLVAMPHAQRRDRKAALQQLEQIKVSVRTLPAFEDLATGRVTVSDLRQVEAEDLLGRDPVPYNAKLMARNITGKCVMVTGAGGSIGSELVRQIICNQPRRLILLERGENELYEIGLEVDTLLKIAFPDAGRRPPVVSVLGSVRNEPLVRSVIKQNGVQTIYHAAAFKHVPMVERNPMVGVRNNTFGTAVLANAAAACNVELLVLISTDKAVRPTSIMGASKRLAEMILQSLAAEGGSRTIFTMVRFGNVLDSSGSVVQRFRKQIEAGGPVTVTHRDMVRYFMSIPEAAALVIQAGSMAFGGEVFVLDMGQPVRIDDLARSMIRLMGRDVKDEAHPDGEIAIEYIGTRDGEKLYEELLIGDDAVHTEHPRIMRIREPFLPLSALHDVLRELGTAIELGSTEELRSILVRVVEPFEPAAAAPPARKTYSLPAKFH